MIVREIQNADTEFYANFDYFNDYKDTLVWAKLNCPDKVRFLEDGYRLWQIIYNKRFK